MIGLNVTGFRDPSSGVYTNSLGTTYPFVAQQYAATNLNFGSASFNGYLFSTLLEPYTYNNANLWVTPGSNTVFSVQDPIAVGTYAVNRLVNDLYFRPLSGSSAAMIDLNKNYMNRNTVSTFLGVPNTSTQIIEVGRYIPESGQKYIEIYDKPVFGGQPIFSGNSLSKLIQPIYTGSTNARWYADLKTGMFDPQGSWRSFEVPSKYDMNRIFVSTTGMYCNYNGTTMFGLVVRYSGNTIYFRYYNRASANNRAKIKAYPTYITSSGEFVETYVPDTILQAPKVIYVPNLF